MHVSKEKTFLSRLRVITRKSDSRSRLVPPAGLAPPSGLLFEKETKMRSKKCTKTEKEGEKDEKGYKQRETERRRKKEKEQVVRVTDSFINKNDIGQARGGSWCRGHVLSPGTIELPWSAK